MSKPEEILARLRGLNQEIRRQDPQLREESMDTRTREELVELPRATQNTEDAIQEESVVLRRLRPVMAIKNNTTEIVFDDADDSRIWKDRLTRSREIIDRAIRSVGRVELRGGRIDWAGTGWLVADNMLVTNRHVANEFSRRSGEGFTFRTGPNGMISARIDFLQEIDNPETLEFKLIRPVHIEEEPGPDVSFFEIELTSGDTRLAGPINLADTIAETANVAIIGYPARDSRIPEPDLMERLYGSVYDKKRLAPGAVTRLEQTRLLHNCTTLGGNSGSVLLDLDSGKAVGLHFSGSFLATNYAVRADVVSDLLRRVRSGRSRRHEDTRASSIPLASSRNTVSPNAMASTSVSITIPLTLTVSIGNLQDIKRVTPRSWSAALRPADAEDGDVQGAEGRVSDYCDRHGYQSDFLGGDLVVQLPTVERDATDVLEFDLNGASEHVLRYEHYSVVMSRSRRMCIFSAVNIDGNLSKKSARVAWKRDPRIPKSQQIMNECYGNPPKFSRGHMTRREDPGWGDAATAKRGNEDSMHVTNTTPQMQAFNSPIWLALEDYALQHAREDKMKISVFTGPYFSRHDPTMHGVRIPRAFWKIIVFIHDETGELCATGYEMDQEQSLPSEDEFVFGAFRSPQLNVATQVPIRSIEARSGLSFGKLASVDPLAGEHEGSGEDIARAPLLALEQIRFVQ